MEILGKAWNDGRPSCWEQKARQNAAWRARWLITFPVAGGTEAGVVRVCACLPLVS